MIIDTSISVSHFVKGHEIYAKGQFFRQSFEINLIRHEIMNFYINSLSYFNTSKFIENGNCSNLINISDTNKI